MSTHKPMKVALTIAGTDSSSGAGATADLRTFAAFEVSGRVAVTAVTAQNRLAVSAIQPIDPDVVGAQIQAVSAEVDAIKCGMLFSAQIVRAVANALPIDIPLVVDPVLVATSGASLAQSDLVNALKEFLLPRALIITPNRAEAEALIGTSQSFGQSFGQSLGQSPGARSPRECALMLGAITKGWALVTTGSDVGQPTDYLSDGTDVMEFAASRLGNEDVHGTGCALSAAITALVALGSEIVPAIMQAREYTRACILEPYG